MAESLEKFSKSEEWRLLLKQNLCMERTHSPSQNLPKIVESRVDLDGDLQRLLELKRNNGKNMYGATGSDVSVSGGDEVGEKYKQNVKWHAGTNAFSASDESFAALERMCDKTASDPNSTLFHYLNADKMKSLNSPIEKVTTTTATTMMIDKEKMVQSNADAETVALRKLFNEFDVREESLQLKSRQNEDVIDLTQLDDVEAPSALWEKSVDSNDTVMQQASPVKMVGLLRPSTIIEEEIDVMTSSSLLSLSSVWSPERKVSVELAPAAECCDVTSSESDNESSCYETAHDDNTFNGDLKLQPQDQKNDDNNDDEDKLQADKLNDCHNQTLGDVSDTVFNSNDSDVDAGLDVDVAINSDDVVSQVILGERSERKSDFSDSPVFNDTIEEVDYLLKKGLKYMKLNGDENVNEAPKEDTSNAMKQEQKPTEFKAYNNDYATFTKSLKPLHDFKTASTATPQTTPAKAKAKVVSAKKENIKPSVQRGNIDLKPIPKLNVFQKPSGIPKFTISSGTGGTTTKRKPMAFSNIVSPIGTYMKNSGHAPLLVSTQTIRNGDMHNTSAIRRLDCLQKQLKKPGVATNPVQIASPRSLPKKAYISSELKHVVDERSPVKIPGGQSIQKYIGNAMISNVVRHDGKIKLNALGANAALIAGGSKIKPPQQKMQAALHDESIKTSGRKTDIADFSIMSGDVSVYAIKNARNF